MEIDASRRHPGIRVIRISGIQTPAQTMRKLTFGIALISLLMMVSGPAAAQVAPRVYLEREGAFGIRLLIDSSVSVNAYNVRVTYDSTIVEIASVDTSHSIATILPQPIIAAGGQIRVRGGSTTAFQGTAGILATFLLKPVGEGVAEFIVTEAVAYQADGSGVPLALDQAAPLPLRITPGTFTSYAQAQASGAVSVSDIEAPKIIVAAVQENPLNYGEHLLVFQAKDEQSGVARYEARDKSWFAWSAWREAVNPYPIGSGAWAVQLKAVDNRGNFALATVYQFGNAIWKAGLMVVLLGIILMSWLSTRKKKQTGV